ncbi:Protein kinase domain-containing protein [Durusdinium trenchii]|uniref:Protein kinase domain-containing protein n=1 Tax=Durusdinium trenchii TaxID=1381693 RepID=A0ABP0L099_9DINO
MAKLADMDESVALAALTPTKLSFADVLEALEAEDIPESHRQNVKEKNERILGMCLGVTCHWSKGATISSATRSRPSITSLLCRFAQQELPGFEFSSIQVNKDYKAAMHVDKNNLGPSFILGLGDYSGGWLWLDDGSKVGRVKNIRNRWFKFDGRKPHCVTPFSGRRYTLVFFTYSNPKMATALSAKEERYLQQLGFPLPKEVLCHSAPKLSRELLPAVWQVPRARRVFERFEDEVERRGGLGRMPQPVQVGQKRLHAMLEPSMPLQMLCRALQEHENDPNAEASTAVHAHSGANGGLFVGSLRLLKSDSIKQLSLGRRLLKARRLA